MNVVKKARKRKTKTAKIATTFTVPITMSTQQYVDMARSFPADCIPEIIAALDLVCEDWGITEQVINHFLAVKQEGEKEVDASNLDLVFKPKKIETTLHHQFL